MVSVFVVIVDRGKPRSSIQQTQNGATKPTSTTPSLPQAATVKFILFHTADQPKPSPLNPTVNTTLTTIETPSPLQHRNPAKTHSRQSKAQAPQVVPSQDRHEPLPLHRHRNPAKKIPIPTIPFMCFAGTAMNYELIFYFLYIIFYFLFLVFSFYYFLCCVGGYGKDGEVKVNVKRRRWMWKLDLALGVFWSISLCLFSYV
jgi:hypothetical protein